MALALDGSVVTGAEGATTTFSTGTLTTSNGSGTVVVGIATNETSITSVAATGLTFTVRKTITNTQGPSVLATYTAPYSANFSHAITVTVPVGNNYGQAIAWALSGCPTSSQFDTHSGIPGSSTSTTSQITTGNPTDFVFSVNALSNTTDTQGTGWTLLSSTGFMLCEYQIVSATGTFTGTTGSGFTNASIIDAIIASTVSTFDMGSRNCMVSAARSNVGWRLRGPKPGWKRRKGLWIPDKEAA